MVLGFIQYKHHQGFQFLPSLLPAFISMLTLTSVFSLTVIRSLPYLCPQHQCESFLPPRLLLRRNTSQKPPLPLPQHLPSGLTGEIYHVVSVMDTWLNHIPGWKKQGSPWGWAADWALTRWMTTELTQWRLQQVCNSNTENIKALNDVWIKGYGNTEKGVVKSSQEI